MKELLKQNPIADAITLLQENGYKVTKEYATQEKHGWVTYEENKELITKEVDPLLLFESGAVRRYSEDWPFGDIVTHFMVNTPELPQKPEV